VCLPHYRCSPNRKKSISGMKCEKESSDEETGESDDRNDVVLQHAFVLVVCILELRGITFDRCPYQSKKLPRDKTKRKDADHRRSSLDFHDYKIARKEMTGKPGPILQQFLNTLPQTEAELPPVPVHSFGMGLRFSAIGEMALMVSTG